ncbi:Serine/threonine-protein kinase PknB [Maioricimonas rarisocia]|uniref:Serine/threonine-protein kinase PknB n=2 Tax=Maioricimonas rarisocia TaxID=2528026 RepID=A0A517Z1S9_9PLAN|nr:Serine/threonine-protein kinase PknB [Maioricimonas rarisocia]
MSGFVNARARSVVRSLSATNIFLRRQIWIWPIIAAIVLGTIGWFLRQAIEQQLRMEMASEMETILRTDVKAMQIWLRSEEENAKSAAGNAELREVMLQLVEMAEQEETTQLDLLTSEELADFRERMQPIVDARGYQGYAVLTRGGRVAASELNEPVGMVLPAAEAEELWAHVDEHGATVTRPRKSIVALRNEEGLPQAGVPTMFALAGVPDETGETALMLGLRIRPEDEFTEILHIARAGESGETYAFDRDGVLISQSRFDDQLRLIGLVTENTDSILNLSVRDPGRNLVEGFRTQVPRSQQPLTRMATSAIAGESGVDVDGYRDYRGVPVIGAWTWLPEYEFGVATELDRAEAYRPLVILRSAFWGLFALLAAAALAIFVFTIIVARLNREARMAELEAKRLGQYTLDEKLGEGGMGVVYRAHHAMLNRPTAVKFLSVDGTNEEALVRFEREVKLTSQLNHPNTIAVYDYGRTDEGTFFYAMEYLDGIDLEELVTRFGPQPPGRVISILTQICGSLDEAHGQGLIHRDVKPANIVLNRRGGLYDFVKLLDFGLVKAVDSRKQASLTASGSMSGTPLYLSPEAIQHPEEVDHRSDLYAVGAVGYYLLTGTTVFDGASVVDIVRQHVEATPDRPSQRLGRDVDTDLENVLLRCLAKPANERPDSANALRTMLQECKATTSWSETDARKWWSLNSPLESNGNTAGTATVIQAATVVGAEPPDAVSEDS